VRVAVRVCWVGHQRLFTADEDFCKTSGVALAVLVADPVRVQRVRVVAGRHGRVGVRAAQVGAAFDLELVYAARAAAAVVKAELLRLGRIGDVPEHEPVNRPGIAASTSAPLDSARGDVVSAQRSVLGGVDDDVLGRGAHRVLQRRDACRVRRF
jgi:hypothetical protein